MAQTYPQFKGKNPTEIFDDSIRMKIPPGRRPQTHESIGHAAVFLVSYEANGNYRSGT